jgi:hypothetical protein
VIIEATEPRPAKSGGEGGISRVAAYRHQDAAGARNVMPRIVCMPGIIEIHLEPGMEVHCDFNGRYADVAEVAAAIARRDVHTAAQGDCEMGEVTTNELSSPFRCPGSPGFRTVDESVSGKGRRRGAFAALWGSVEFYVCLILYW